MSFHILLDFDLLLYVGLVVLFVWRVLCPWRCCGQWLEYTNVMMVLFALIFVLLCAELVQFIIAAVDDNTKQHNPVALRVILALAPPAMFANLPLCLMQVRQHIPPIRKKDAAMKHDRAIQILALPSVYGIMALSSLVQMYTWTLSNSGSEEAQRTAEGRYENCMYVADLYEAWALFQFGKLTLELVDETMARNVRHGSDSSERVVMSFTAVAELTQLGWSVWFWTFVSSDSPSFESLEGISGKLWAAGLVASGAAIYNVHVVEKNFGVLIEGYRPLLKFLSVKLLVFFAFWQHSLLNVIKYFGWLKLSADQVSLLHSALLSVECLVSALLHYWAWPVTEGWYGETSSEDKALSASGAAAGELKDDKRGFGHRAPNYQAAV